LQRKEALKVIDVDNSGKQRLVVGLFKLISPFFHLLQTIKGKMSLIEYLLWKFKKTIAAVANASQGKTETTLNPLLHKSCFDIGDNKAEIEECQRKIAEVQAALEEVLLSSRPKLEASKVAAQRAQTALRECQAARAENEKKLAQQKVAVQESKSALIKVKAALEGE
jgi:hypothetical protein